MKAIEIDVLQGSPEWIALRKEKIGSSDAAKIDGVSKWGTQYSLWCEKLDLIPPKEVNSSMIRGNELEPVARERLEKQFGIKFMPGVFVNDFMIASLDGICQNNEVAIEIKWPNINDHRVALEGKVPVHYYPQLQHIMIALDLKEIIYSSNHEVGTVDFFVNRDEKYCEKLLVKEKQFWQYLQTLESPPLCDRDYVERKDAEWFEKALEWHRINRQLKSLEKREDELRQDLIELAQGKNCKGAGVKISCSVRKGQVNYASIPNLDNVDIEKYRKPKTIVWRLGEI